MVPDGKRRKRQTHRQKLTVQRAGIVFCDDGNIGWIVDIIHPQTGGVIRDNRIISNYIQVGHRRWIGEIVDAFGVSEIGNIPNADVCGGMIG